MASCVSFSRVRSSPEASLGPLEKVACGAFSDISFVAGRERRDFRGLRQRHPRKSNRLLLAINLHCTQLICTTVTSVIFIRERRRSLLRSAPRDKISTQRTPQQRI